MKEQSQSSEIAQKAVMSLDEVSTYTGFTRRYLLKLTSLRKIPYYKPLGKSIFFRRDELEAWLTTGRIKPITEIEAEAQVFCDKNKGGASDEHLHPTRKNRTALR